MQISKLSQLNFGSPIYTNDINGADDTDKNERFKEILDNSKHPTARLNINRRNSSPVIYIKDSIQAGYPVGLRQPKYNISIHDFIIKKNGDTYEHNMDNISRNAVVNGNVNLSNVNGEGAVLVVSDYPVYHSIVTEKDVRKAIAKYDKLIQKTLKLLK